MARAGPVSSDCKNGPLHPTASALSTQRSPFADRDTLRGSMRTRNSQLRASLRPARN